MGLRSWRSGDMDSVSPESLTTANKGCPDTLASASVMASVVESCARSTSTVEVRGLDCAFYA